MTGDNNYVAQIINIYRENDAKVDEAELERQIREYLTTVRARYGKIVLRGLQRGPIDLDLEQVYVPLQATIRAARRTTGKRAHTSRRSVVHEELVEAEKQDIRLDQLLGLGKRLVVTGGPGCGKTTVLQHIAWALATSLYDNSPTVAAEKLGVHFDSKTKSVSPLLLPIYVPLSAYAEYRRDLRQRSVADDPHRITLIRFISHYLIERQLALRLSADFFVRLLEKGQAVVLLLDGLDEVPNEEERKLVRDAIEQLNDKEALHIVVTCRIAAYNGESMLSEDFLPVETKPLEEEHVLTLIKQAFACIAADDPGEEARQSNELIAGTLDFENERQQRMGESYQRLIDTPLMVRLLLIVYLNGRGFPQQRADLYEQATKALLVPDYTLDAETATRLGKQVGGDALKHRDLVEYLAFQLHSKGDSKRELQGREIEEEDLKALLRVVPDFAPLVQPFIAFCRQRGGLLEERLRTYRFFHHSFQEYLTASYLAKTRLSEGVDQLAHFFEGEVNQYENAPLLESWWREPALLVAGHFMTNQYRSAAERFLRRLAGIDPAASQRDALPPNLTLRAVEIAAVSATEWLKNEKDFCAALAERIAALFADTSTMNAAEPALRVAAANALAKLGDPRPGVVHVANPNRLTINDLAWSELIDSKPFIMGSDKQKDNLADDDEMPQFECNLITQPYRISRYPITVAIYRIFIETKGYEQEQYWTKAGWQWRTENQTISPEKYGSVFELDNHPQIGVSWYEAVAFCNWFSEQNGLPMNNIKRSIRLPSEAEWERAARGTEGDIYPWGNDWDEKKCNNTYLNLGATTAVGIFPAGNAICGAADVSGNIWEWCSTKWLENYEEYEKKVDNQAEGSDRRLLRGGSFVDGENFVLCASRLHSDPDLRNNDVGFRLLLPGSKSLDSSVLCSLIEL